MFLLISYSNFFRAITFATLINELKIAEIFRNRKKYSLFIYYYEVEHELFSLKYVLTFLDILNYFSYVWYFILCMNSIYFFFYNISFFLFYFSLIRNVAKNISSIFSIFLLIFPSIFWTEIKSFFRNIST